MGGKRLAINFIANAVAFAVQFGINFILTPFIVKSLGSEAYGFVQLSNNIIGYINIITVALNSMSGRFICIEMSRKNAEKAKEYFNSVLIANTVLAVLLAVPSALLVIFANTVMNVPSDLLSDVQVTFAFAMIAMEVQLIFNVFSTVFYATNRVDLQAKRNIEGNILRAGVLVVLFMSFAAHVWYVTATMLVVEIYLGLFNIRYTRTLAPELTVSAKTFRWSAVRKLLSSGIWNSVNQLSVVLLTTLDIYLVNIFIGAQAAGQYSLAKTLPNFLQSFVGTLVSVFIPEFTILYAQHRKKDLLNSIDFSVKVMGYLMTLPIGFLIVFGEDFFRLWVPTQDALLLQGLSLLTIIPMIVTGSINTIYNVYTVTNKLRTPALVWVVFGVLNVATVIGLFEFTNLGIWSVPIAAFAWGLFRNLTFTPMYAAHCLGVRWYTFYKAIVRGMLCAMTMVVVSFAYSLLFPTDSWVMLIIAAAICALVSGIANFFLVFNASERTKMLNLVRNKFKGKAQAINS
ncbi:lipopolysaccharide biosynthesis protein [Bifidobacterium pseudocatenulatum]|uniref:Oligosaccharide flippase family protein n=1 Tax=Bifidobacterium pseudocatenulatum TaxID=28026 RepID=A0A3E5HIZ4_BIFPS|nr:oligosaccharide flippase family protein [Bifidobacterium pseudocatenulatum]RGP01735.1 hypothetical protein DXA79_08650 [Bifidobacterium pseudocatenulatum]RGT67993.1 hypothetical protein DWX12_05985 [Bifidobacterium pseudocatenulatum]